MQELASAAPQKSLGEEGSSRVEVVAWLVSTRGIASSAQTMMG